MVLESAARLIADEGLLEATMRRIAKAADISLGTLTHHFESVDQLLAEALDLASIRFTERLTQSIQKGTALERLHKLINAVIPVDAETLRQWRLWIAFWSRSIHERKLGKTHVRRYGAWKATIGSLINAGVADGSFPPDLDVTAMTQQMVALIDGVCFQVAVRGNGMSAAEAKKIVRHALKVWLRTPSAVLVQRQRRTNRIGRAP